MTHEEAAFSIVCCRLNMIFSSRTPVGALRLYLLFGLEFLMFLQLKLFYKENGEKATRKNVKSAGELMQAHTENGWFNYTIAYHRFA